VPPVDLNFSSTFTLYSVELQHVWKTPRYSLIVGGRWQTGDVDSHATQTRILPATDQNVSSDLQRQNAYAYGSWQIFDPLRLIAGVSYDHVTFPNNVDLPPLTTGDSSRDLVAPKAGLVFEPWKGGLLRASYTKSLGGLYFDNSVRIEPTQVAGFNQAFRSLIPESVAGLVPGTEFETIGVGFDQSLPSGTWFGVEAEQLKSNGNRDVGAFSSFAVLLAPQTATTTSEKLDFRERSLSAYAGQLIGNNLSIGARYRVSEAKLQELFPNIPDSAIGLDQLESNDRATLQQLSLTANFHHRCGAFAQWETAWYHQSNSGFNPATPGDDFWQQNLTAGYRFPRRTAELRVGVLNLFDTDYRLNPLNLHAELPRGRTFIASLRLNF
jgi:outer membrane receptor for monomeric catechols